MRIEEFGNHRFDIHLSGEELRAIFGGYEYIDYDNKECREKIHSLIYGNIPENISLFECRKILIEVKPARSGCTISLIKCREIGNREAEYITMIFKSCDDLLSAVASLSKVTSAESSLYTKDKKYALICAITAFNMKSALHICEYCKISYRRIDAVKIKEYWQSVCETEALEKLKRAFL